MTFRVEMKWRLTRSLIILTIGMFTVLMARNAECEVDGGPPPPWSDVCDEESENALPCIFNPYWCNEEWDPYCICDSMTEECTNICEFINCPEDEVCIPSDGSCQLIQDNCWIQGCLGGTICVGGECIGDPCYEVECDNPQYCNNEGECVDPCFSFDCDNCEGCFEGECVDDPCVGVACDDSETCNHETGNCQVIGPCLDVDCEFFEVCVDGECVEDPCWNLECPNGLQCIFGACYEYVGYSDQNDSDCDMDSDEDTDTDTDSSGDTSDTGTDPQGNDQALDNVLGTGIGGCLCTTTPGLRGNDRSVTTLILLISSIPLF